MEVKIANFLSTLFRNKDFISQESSILADVENIVFWFRILKSIFSTKKSQTVTRLERRLFVYIQRIQ